MLDLFQVADQGGGAFLVVSTSLISLVSCPLWIVDLSPFGVCDVCSEPYLLIRLREEILCSLRVAA